VSTEMADMVLEETREKMQRAVSHTKGEFSSIRTGRAAPALVEKIAVDYYGTVVPLQQLASFQVPEARQLLITPYDKGSMGAIEKAIQHSDLGLNPSNDGHSIRLSFPPLTAERRKDLVRVVKHMAEEGRVALRNIPRATRHEIDGLNKEHEITDDEVKRYEAEIDKMTHAHEAEIDRALEAKEKELLED
jgi:ribosome recycling factor